MINGKNAVHLLFDFVLFTKHNSFNIIEHSRKHCRDLQKSTKAHQVPEAQQQQAPVAAEKVMEATVAYI